MKTPETPVDPATAVGEEDETAEVWIPDAPTHWDQVTPVMPVVLPDAATVEVPLLRQSEADVPTRLDVSTIEESEHETPTVLDLAAVGDHVSEVPTTPELAAIPEPAVRWSSTTGPLDVRAIGHGARTAEALVSEETKEQAVGAKADVALDLDEEMADSTWEESDVEGANSAGAAFGGGSLTEDFDEGVTGLLPMGGRRGATSPMLRSSLRGGGRGWSPASLGAHPLRWGILGFLCLLVPLAILLWPGGREEGEADRPAAGDSAQARALEAFEQGVTLVHQRDWWGASLRFAEAAALDPSNPEPPAYLERVGREAAFAERAVRAQRCLDSGDLSCARAEVDGIEINSLVFEDIAAELIPALEKMEEDGGEERSGGSGTTAAAEGPVGATDRPTSGLPAESTSAGGARSLAPPHGKTSNLLPRRPEAQAGVSASPRPSANTTAPSSSPSGTAKVRKGVREVRIEEAPIAEGGLDPAEEAQRHLQAGARARAGGNLEKAAWHLEQALGAAPENPLVLKELEELRGLLPGLFREAYASRASDPEGAMQKLRLVIRHSAPGSELRAKAQKWLGRLEDPP